MKWLDYLFFNSYNWFYQDGYNKTTGAPYIRAGINYYKVIKKTDRWGIERTELKPWKKEEIKQDITIFYKTQRDYS